MQGLDTFMKHIVRKVASGDALAIFGDLKVVKDFLRNIKQINVNKPQGCTLEQKCETRLKTTQVNVERFLKFMHHLQKADKEGAHVRLWSLTFDQIKPESYTALKALVVFFSLMRHVQTALEAAH